MVDIDPAGDIGGMMAELRSEIDRADLAGQGLEPESHVTVRYGILADRDLNGLRQYLRSLEPFEIRFGVVSSFPATEHSDNAAVLKVDVGSPVLDEINAAISQHVSFKPANFEYHSNATLAYVTPEAVDKYVGNDLLVGQTMEVTSISITMPDMPAEIVPLIGEHAHWHDEPAEKLAKYSDDQERDENGRWTSGGWRAHVNFTIRVRRQDGAKSLRQPWRLGGLAVLRSRASVRSEGHDETTGVYSCMMRTAKTSVGAMSMAGMDQPGGVRMTTEDGGCDT